MSIPFRSLTPVLVIAVALSGCDPTGPQQSTATLGDASFSVISVNDTTVPWLTPVDSCYVLHDGGRATFYANGRFTLYISYGTDLCNGHWAGASIYSGSGTYTREGDKITFNLEPYGSLTGTWSANGGGTGSNWGQPVTLPGIAIFLNGQAFRLAQQGSEVQP